MTAPHTARFAAAGPLTLQAGGTTVALDPARGGRITALRMAGRAWLAADGLDETIALDGGAPADALAGAAVAQSGDAVAVARVEGPGHVFERTATVQADGTLRLEYALTRRGDAAAAVHWAARAHLPLVPNTRLDLPVAARVRVAGERDVALGGAGALHRWPVLRVGPRDATPFGPREVDFTFPALAPRRFGDAGRADYACDLLLELPRPSAGTVRLGVEQDGARLECAVDPTLTPLAALTVDAGAESADGAAGTLALGPALGLPPALGDAAAAFTLAPGETWRWAVLWRGRAASVGA